MAVTYTWAVTGWETRTEPGAPDGTGAERADTVIQTRWTKTGKDGSFEGVFSGATPFSAAASGSSVASRWPRPRLAWPSDRTRSRPK